MMASFIPSLRRVLAAGAFATGLLAAQAGIAAEDAELIMVDRAGCPYCIAWKDQIGPAYPNTDLGKYAPLRIVDIRDGAPDGVSFSRPALFTPTFILIRDGQELGRIEGYPGEDFFWGLLEKLMRETTDFDGSS